jgi:hypothetical protein
VFIPSSEDKECLKIRSLIGDIQVKKQSEVENQISF